MEIDNIVPLIPKFNISVMAEKQKMYYKANDNRSWKCPGCGFTVSDHSFLAIKLNPECRCKEFNWSQFSSTMRVCDDD